ncbi:DUF4065 domain-containing protein [Candidatus Gracilibacteria bacterium]|nr:DUF4065 domain-containing protein [Candidatus Gracilibacteria bacterium]MCF7856775.1 DUF4065 domain-containing protein [Candidatus Gracilibacteria bacterium]MCF7897061.1 DUF4065 domain-containing protein [Candidatus Gracilibacteria bacterium]
MQNLIIKLRKTAKLSQADMAEKLGMSRPTFIEVEKGTRDITLTELKKMARIFDIPIDIFLDEELGIEEKAKCQNFSEKSFKKFHDLVLQCIKCGADEDGKITKTKLAKLVYLCDFAHYYKHLKPISGFEYRRLPQGPVSIEFFEIIDNDDSICVEPKSNAMMISLIEKPSSSVLDANEKAIVKAVCRKWKSANTKEIVDFTHKQIPWKVCRDGEVIPYTLINSEAPEDVY